MLDPGLYLVKIGILFLVYMSWEDFKTGKVDMRKNGFMLGGALTAFMATQEVLLAIIPLFVLAYGIGELYKRTYGTGDLQTLYWIIPLLFILEWWYPLAFLPLLGLTTTFSVLVKRHNGIIGKTPGMINFTFAYLLIVGNHFYYQLWPTGCALSFLCY